MLDDLAGLSTGARIQTLRTRKGMTRLVLAGLVGRSSSWLKDIERGRRLPPRLPMLVRLAEVLGVTDVSVLAGDDMNLGGGTISVPIDSFRRIPHEAVPAIREAIHDQQLTRPERRVDVAALRSRVDHAWGVWHSSPRQRTDIGRVLPGLITDARVAARTANGDRRDAYATLADVYGLAEQMLAWTSEAELLWLAADRGVAAAQEADRPETLAGAAWVLGNVRRAVGDYDGAIELVEDARQVLEPRLEDGPDSVRGIWGALNLHAAITCARAGREGDAWRYWDEGDRTAERLGVRYSHPWTAFGQGNVSVHAVSVGADLSQSSKARERAEEVDPDSVPSLERRSRLLIETARSYSLKRDHSGALHWVKQAHRVSSEAVHYSPIARQMVSDAVDQGGPLIERDARSFGQVLGLPV
ncbi:helix-turn-helix domain-containing protein [Actinomadura alba]|uniref:Helix-turn-helix domain-containing protein n=2 Tax=Actinomadura alba TaxID=406431 RepID=A0ABR7M1M0_9ACTN|nr:helix-turn-helix transcriptional regulator [Actinomadura alba]MBC6470964.1 helix-turn-helix domain-containing protein [Actinomadura alba]